MTKAYLSVSSVSAMFLLSLVSGYTWDPKLKEQALESFLFLTPSGLLKNSGPESTYAEFYSQISGRFREGFFDNSLLILVEILLLGLCFYSLYQWRKKS